MKNNYIKIGLIFFFVIALVVLLIIHFKPAKYKEVEYLYCVRSVTSRFDNIKTERVEAQIEFRKNGTAVKEARRIITATIAKNLSEKDKNEIGKKLSQNYCNSEVDNKYLCDYMIYDKTIEIEEFGMGQDVFGINSVLSIEEYKDMLENKKYKCDIKDESVFEEMNITVE